MKNEKNKVPWQVLKRFAQDCSNDDLGLTLTFLWQCQICFLVFIWEEFMELIEDFSAKVNKHSSINEYMNIFFCNKGQDHSLTVNQCVSYLTIANK